MDERASGRYTVKELADRGGVTPRTVYYYVGEGLLPAPEGGGPASTYTDDHLLRLRLIRRLKDEYLPLAEIRRRLADLTTDELRTLLDAPAAAPPPDSARAYLARLLGDPRAAEPSTRPQSPGRPRAGRPRDRSVPTDNAGPEDPTEVPMAMRAADPPQSDGAPLPRSRLAPRPTSPDSESMPGAAPQGSPAAFARPAPASPPAPGPARRPQRTDDRPTEETHAAPAGPLPEPARSSREAGSTSAGRPPDSAEVASILAEVESSESWQRVRIAPGVELHIRAADAPSLRSRLGRIVDALRRILET